MPRKYPHGLLPVGAIPGRGLIMETAGARDQVLKFLPPLVIEEDLLGEGLGILDQALEAVLEQRRKVMGTT